MSERTCLPRLLQTLGSVGDCRSPTQTVHRPTSIVTRGDKLLRAVSCADSLYELSYLWIAKAEGGESPLATAAPSRSRALRLNEMAVADRDNFTSGVRGSKLHALLALYNGTSTPHSTKERSLNSALAKRLISRQAAFCRPGGRKRVQRRVPYRCHGYCSTQASLSVYMNCYVLIDAQ